ncbi:MAG: tail fiber assembly protein [Comamonas sp.]
MSKAMVLLGDGCKNGRFFNVMRFKISSQDIDEDDSWRSIETPLGFELSGPLIYDVANNKIIKRPEKKDSAEVFDLETCSWVMSAIAQWEKVRGLRDELMTATDWRVTRAMEAGQPLAAEWVAYRQALRDVTQQPDPFAIVWPVAPDKQSTEAPTEVLN